VHRIAHFVSHDPLLSTRYCAAIRHILEWVTTNHQELPSPGKPNLPFFRESICDMRRMSLFGSVKMQLEDDNSNSLHASVGYILNSSCCSIFTYLFFIGLITVCHSSGRSQRWRRQRQQQDRRSDDDSSTGQHCSLSLSRRSTFVIWQRRVDRFTFFSRWRALNSSIGRKQSHFRFASFVKDFIQEPSTEAQWGLQG